MEATATTQHHSRQQDSGLLNPHYHLVSNHGAQGIARQIEQALADLESVEKKNTPDLFAGVGS